MNTNKNLEISLYAHLKKQDYARFINILTSICGAQYKKFQEYEMGLLPISKYIATIQYVFNIKS
jgi:hypothetical protein